MKTTITIIILAISAASCRTGKNLEHIQANTVSQAQGRVSSYAWRQLDSNQRHWLYWGDSSFYYHPDKGLYASRGSLWIEELRLKDSLVQHRDASFAHHAQQESARKALSSTYKKPWWIHAMVAAMMLLLVYGYWKGTR